MKGRDRYDATVQRYRDHLLALATTHRLRVAEGMGVDPGDGHACPVTREVFLPEINNDTSYAVGLHEMGHLIAPGGHGVCRKVCFNQGCQCPPSRKATVADFYDKMVEEETAWDWARRMALDWTVGMEQTRQLAMNTYWQGLALLQAEVA